MAEWQRKDISKRVLKDLEEQRDALDKEDSMPFHRQIRCCGNCTNFFYYSGKGRRGVCFSGIVRPKKFYSKQI